VAPASKVDSFVRLVSATPNPKSPCKSETLNLNPQLPTTSKSQVRSVHCDARAGCLTLRHHGGERALAPVPYSSLVGTSLAPTAPSNDAGLRCVLLSFCAISTTTRHRIYPAPRDSAPSSCSRLGCPPCMLCQHPIVSRYPSPLPRELMTTSAPLTAQPNHLTPPRAPSPRQHSPRQPDDVAAYYNTLNRAEAVAAIAHSAHLPLLLAYAFFFAAGVWAGPFTRSLVPCPAHLEP
jgi:hypothetical protein